MLNTRLHFLLLLPVLHLFIHSCAPAPETAPGPPPVRGFWLTNVDSDAMDSREGLQEVVRLCEKWGFNTIYTCTWNRGYTLYPSPLMDSLFGKPIDPRFAGRDPLQELIELARPKGIRVIAWLEFGFASSYEEPDGGHLLRARPKWAARDTAGAIVSKNGFQWMNAFDPEVQSFIRQLALEVARRYDIDGIQGDDRLPALPSTAGYDSLTVALYQAAHKGLSPPANPKDTAWVAWRAGLLNQFMGTLSDALQAESPGLVRSFSPSIYPWSKYEYLQDWPTWVRNGWADEIIPQVYRYDFPAYKKALLDITQEQLAPEGKALLAPGILLKVGEYVAPDTLLQQMVGLNRQEGIQGEVFFFYEGLRERPAFFEQLY
ncbi:glycoside hydrolase family 10 protein [Phaeodactylibacter luteus]|uniref:Family 10 glycosylhydrolase n=1 Tax=Phaeodactylibacter luteus TaxID=1564516 RepID=A0A5C6RID1_9BACT|nr:family 10 glycosylhydrolase [Phaeodactylibacter luteus]TXB62051.1 family 10 glycosylhydrolase [Phaeodactylibacter luteus]